MAIQIEGFTPSVCSIRPPSSQINLPGMFNAINGPRVFFKEAKALYHAHWPAAQEKIINATIRLIQSPLLIAEAMCTIAFDIFKFMRSTRPIVRKLALTGGGLGTAICTIEAAHETLELYRTVRFHHMLKPLPKTNTINPPILNAKTVRALCDTTIAQQKKYETCLSHKHARQILHKLQKDAKLSDQRFSSNYLSIYNRLSTLEHLYENTELAQTLQTIHTNYLSITPKQSTLIDANTSLPPSKKEELQQTCIQENKNSLAGRVEVWAACEIAEKLPQILRTLEQSPSRHARSRSIKRLQKAQMLARKEATDLIKIMKTQTYKKIVTHAIAYTAIISTMIGIGLGMAAIAPYVSMALLVGGTATAFFRSLYIQGVCNTKGWRVKWCHFVPDALKSAAVKRRYEMIKSRTKRFALMALRICTLIGVLALRTLISK